MAERIKLVQGDTRPVVSVALSDSTGPLDLSDPATTVLLKFREEGTTEILAEIEGTKLTGYEVDGVLITTPPYDVAGAGGRCEFSWLGTTALDGQPGNYEGEVEVTFADTSVQTAYNTVKFKLREQF